MKAVAAALLALGSVQPARAADWRLAGQSDRAVSFIDVASITRNGDSVRFSRWMVMATVMRGGADNVRDSFDVDCQRRDYKVMKAEFFQHDKAAGAVSFPPTGHADAGTILSSLADIACGRRKADGTSVADPYEASRALVAASPHK